MNTESNNINWVKENHQAIELGNLARNYIMKMVAKHGTIELSEPFQYPGEDFATHIATSSKMGVILCDGAESPDENWIAIVSRIEAVMCIELASLVEKSLS